MPIYEYKCSKCGKISEFLVRSEADLNVKCTHCGSDDLEKQISVFNPKVKEGESKKCHSCTDHSCPHSMG